MQKLILALLVPTAVMAQQDCVMQQKTVNRAEVSIKEITDIKRTVVSFGANQKCTVSFKAMIDGKWHPAYGEYVWDGERPTSEACGAAVTQAKKDLTEKVKPSTIISEDILVCRDDVNKKDITSYKKKDLVDISTLRPHWNNKTSFMHEGVPCKWFFDTKVGKKGVEQYSLIACKLNVGWVVEDTF